MRLIDADALLDGEQTIPYPDVPFDTLGMMVDWFIQLVEKQPTIPAPRWVRCEDDMPKEDGAYAVGWLYPSGCFYWCKLLFLNGEWQVIDVPEPDYWMPIEPPKEDA